MADRYGSLELPLLALLTVIVLVVGALVNALVAPSAGWVANLVMPPILLPQMVTAVLGLVLGVGYAVSGWRIWRQSPALLLDFGLWWAILALSWVFTPAFISMRAASLAIAIVGLMTLLLAALAVRTLRSGDRLSALILALCTLYGAYVVALSAWVVAINRIPG